MLLINELFDFLIARNVTLVWTLKLSNLYFLGQGIFSRKKLEHYQHKGTEIDGGGLRKKISKYETFFLWWKNCYIFYSIWSHLFFSCWRPSLFFCPHFPARWTGERLKQVGPDRIFLHWDGRPTLNTGLHFFCRVFSPPVASRAHGMNFFSPNLFMVLECVTHTWRIGSG